MTQEGRSSSRFPWWVVTTYFAEGFPYSLVRQISTVFFKDSGASLEAIGLTSLYGLPWTLKFLWAPLVDSFATKRRWLVSAEAVLVGLVALMAVISGSTHALALGALLFLVMALASATHDIAIDGFYLEAFDQEKRARWVGFQAFSYRLALVAGGGLVVAFSGITSWPAGFALAAVVLGALLAVHGLFLPSVEKPGRPARELAGLLLRPRVLLILAAAAAAIAGGRELLQQPALSGVREVLGRLSLPSWIVLCLLAALIVLATRAPALKRRLYASRSSYALAFVDYLDQPRIGLVLAFIVLYRTGESFLLNMAYPFLNDIGVSRAQYGIAYGTFGIAASIAGGLIGGALIARYGLRRCIWPFVVGQNVLNLLYMGMAWKYAAIFQNPAAGSADLRLVTGLIVVEAFGAGLGTAAFMVFIMRTTKSGHKAAHFAIGTALMQVSATMAGVFSGFLADSLGFVVFFGITFLATIPAMALIPFLPPIKADPPRSGPAGE